MAINIGDKNAALFTGLSGFWQKFFRDTQDLQAFYQASEIYLGQAYLDLMAAVLNVGLIDTPVFNKEYWKLFAIDETQVHYLEGASIAEDRYVYDMPGTIVTTDFLQNTIFDPDVLFERDVDFNIFDNDGFVRFLSDPFMDHQDSNGEWLPPPGIAWRTVQKSVGNQITDFERTVNWVDDSDAKRGDTLRLLAHRGALLEDGAAGAITVLAGSLVFTGVGVGGVAKAGDILQIFDSAVADEPFNGYYVVKEALPPDQVLLDDTFYCPTVASTLPLNWKLFRGLAFSPARDFEVDYFDGKYIVGSSDNPYPLDLNDPVVYAVVRTPADYFQQGIPLVPHPLVLPYAPIDLGFKHIVPGTLVLYAHSATGLVKEGLDYSVDYWRGIVYPLTAWHADSVFTCDFEYREEVFYSAGGAISEKTVGRVKQIALWTPEVLVDRFTLAYNYGSMLNRFEASSETYKAFLRGVMYLYLSGPILERVESAMDLAAGYPVVKNEGEILQGYDNGEDGSGVDGSINGPASSFNTPTYTFSELDVGGYVVISGAVNDVNNGKFLINTVIDDNTVELESAFPLVTEGAALVWVVTREYKKTVTTDQRVYSFPYNVPIRTDVMDLANFGSLTFHAFESLTLAFRVTDYVEDPNWWHDKYIPRVLWPNAVPPRRYAYSELIPNVITPLDGACIGDPGFFIGADDAGNPAPTPPTPDVCTSFRHTTAFILFDRYLKFHMFYVEIDPDLELSDDFTRDLREIVLISKPSYTYPYVEPGEIFTDSFELEDDFWIGRFGFHWGDDEVLEIVYNKLLIGDTTAPWNIGDYYRYVDSIDVPTAAVTPVTAGSSFVLPVNISPVVPEQRVLGLRIQATATLTGEDVREGTDYWVDWIADSPAQWTVYALTDWTSPPVLLVDMLVLEIDNVSINPVPDTQIGFTPYTIGCANAGTLRNMNYDPVSPPPFPTAAQWLALKTGVVDRALSLKINANTGIPGGASYVY